MQVENASDGATLRIERCRPNSRGFHHRANNEIRTTAHPGLDTLGWGRMANCVRILAFCFSRPVSYFGLQGIVVAQHGGSVSVHLHLLAGLFGVFQENGELRWCINAGFGPSALAIFS